MILPPVNRRLERPAGWQNVGQEQLDHIHIAVEEHHQEDETCPKEAGNDIPLRAIAVGAPGESNIGRARSRDSQVRSLRWRASTSGVPALNAGVSLNAGVLALAYPLATVPGQHVAGCISLRMAQD